MSLKIKIAARLKAKAAGANLSKERIDAIVLRAEKGLTDESDDTLIDANLDAINELTPFKDIAALDDHERAKAKKIADDKAKLEQEAAEKAAKEGKVELPEDAPAWMKTFMEAQALQTKALTDQLAAFGSERVANTRREQYAKALEGTSETYKTKALKDFDRLTFKDDEDFTGWLTESTEDAKGFAQENANDGLGGFKPVGGAGDAQKKEKVAAPEVVDAIMNAI